MKAIDTYYNGKLFRSRLEARWAVFFDQCGVSYEYEPEGYDLGDGIWYLPDFLLHDVVFNHAGYKRGQDLYVEVKGKMSSEDAQKIRLFSQEKPILVVGELPLGEDYQTLCESMEDAGHASFEEFNLPEFNFETVDGDYFGAYPGIDLDGYFNLFGNDSTYLDLMDQRGTVIAYRKARCARFEYGDSIVKRLRAE